MCVCVCVVHVCVRVCVCHVCVCVVRVRVCLFHHYSTSPSLYRDRLGELERDNVRLTEKLASQEREQLARQMDMLKKTKSKNLIKRGFNKLKGKIQVGGTPLITCSPHPSDPH